MRFLFYPLFITLITGVTFSCSKEETGCENMGGVIPNHYYTFWIRQESACTTVINVDIFDDRGNKKSPLGSTGGSGVIRTFYQPSNCDAGNNSYAKYGLAIGRTFRYEAYCNSAVGIKTWQGTFKVPCNANGCTVFEIK